MSHPEHDPVQRAIDAMQQAFRDDDGTPVTANSGMSVEQAAEIARRTGNTDHLVDHWEVTRVALLHDSLEALLHDPPAWLPGTAQAVLWSAVTYLRAALDEAGERA